jgi:AcrR family transcriptional regulator
VSLRRDARDNLERVITAATEVFASQGLSATLADVARHAGVGVGTVYRRFASKDDLIYEVIQSRFKAAEQLVIETSETPDAWAGFVRFFEISTQELVSDKGLREFVMGGYTESLGWSRGTPPDRLVGLIARTREAMGHHLAELVRRTKETGRLRADFEASDMMVLSLSVQATIGFGGQAHPELYRRTLGFILDGLLASRTHATELPVPALSNDELDSTVR